MLCKDCKDKPLARGIKIIKCFKCGKETIVNCDYSNVCNDCSDIYVICQYCGKEIKKIMLDEISTKLDLLTGKESMIELDPKNHFHREWFEE